MANYSIEGTVKRLKNAVYSKEPDVNNVQRIINEIICIIRKSKINNNQANMNKLRRILLGEEDLLMKIEDYYPNFNLVLK